MDATDAVERIVEGQAPPRLYAEHRARYAFAAGEVRHRRVLDVACGSGYGSRLLRDAGARAVVGVDLSAEAVAYARQRYGGGAGLTFVEGDAHQPPVTGPFDLVVSFETIEHLEGPERFLRAVVGLLSPEGSLLVSTPYRRHVLPDGRPRNPFHRQEWQTADFQELLYHYFREVRLFGQALKLEKRRWAPRALGAVLARAQGVVPGDVEALYPLPGPRLLGAWRPCPAYLVAVCRGPLPPLPRKG
jgi:SAM-dependent methyltransferase